MAQRRTRPLVVLAEQETTYNTDPSPLAADFVLVKDVKFGYDDVIRFSREKYARQTLPPLASIRGGELVKIDFAADIAGSGSAVDSAPAIGKLLKSSGWKETITPATRVVYTLSSVLSDMKSLTFYIYEDGSLYKFTGCRGTSKLSFKPGEPGQVQFSFVGHFTGKTDDTAPAITDSTPTPPVWLNAGLAYNSFTGVVDSLEIDPGIEIAKPKSVNATDGFGEIQVTGRKVTGKAGIFKDSFANFNPFTLLEADTRAALATANWIGSSSTNRYKISLPKVQVEGIEHGDEGGLAKWDLSFLATEDASAGDDDVSLTFHG